MIFAALGLAIGCSSELSGVGDTEPVVTQSGVPWDVPVRADWPTAGWTRAEPADVGLDPAAVERAVTYAFSRQGDDKNRDGVRTNALVIVKNGRLIVEQYARETTADTPVLTWSVSKSFVNTLFGAAVNDGYLHLDDSASKYYAPLDIGRKREIRVTDLLRMSSGLDWAETYETSPVFSSVMAMLYTRGRGDMALFAASQPLVHPPGKHWAYSSGNTNILMAVLEGALPKGIYEDYPWTVMAPLGVSDFTFERDAAGTYVGSSYLYMKPLDIAKWAYLYANDGVWEGNRVMADGWVRYTTTLAPGFETTPISRASREDNPGAQWYVNVGDPGRGLEPPLAGLPTDLFGAQGHWGKRIWVLPSQDLIVVRMGDDREHLCGEGESESEDCATDPMKVWDDATFLHLLLGTTP